MALNKINKQTILRIALCVIGSFILAFATAVFLTPANIVAGGISGIGIIINYFVEPIIHFQVIDIIVWTMNVILFVVSFFTLGKKFTLHTLISTFAYPLFLTLIMRTGMFGSLSKYFLATSSEFDNLRLLLAGIFGGLLVGLGVAITFIGDGSTGGLDVLCFVLYKYTHIKQSVSSFMFDAIIIIASVSMPEHVIPMFIGILSALLSAIVIDTIYVKTNNSYIVDIITAKSKEVNKYIIDELSRTTTIIDATGAFSNKKLKLVRFVVDRRYFQEVKDHIAEIDPKAFITICDSNLVLGEGFLPLKSRIKRKKNARK